MITRTQTIISFALAVAAGVSAQASVGRTADDAHIETAVEAALESHPALGASSSIQVQSIDHVVYLHGLVDNYPEKLLVQSLASKTEGVERVVNSLELQNQ